MTPLFEQFVIAATFGVLHGQTFVAFSLDVFSVVNQAALTNECEYQIASQHWRIFW